MCIYIYINFKYSSEFDYVNYINGNITTLIFKLIPKVYFGERKKKKKKERII